VVKDQETKEDHDQEVEEELEDRLLTIRSVFVIGEIEMTQMTRIDTRRIETTETEAEEIGKTNQDEMTKKEMQVVTRISSKFHPITGEAPAHIQAKAEAETEEIETRTKGRIQRRERMVEAKDEYFIL